MVPSLVPGMSIASLLNQEWQAEAGRRAFWRSCDTLRASGKSYVFGNDGDGFQIIPKHPREDQTRWDLRRALAKPVSYVGQIANHFISHVFARDAERDPLPTTLQQIMDDADGLGTTLPRVLRNAGRKAFVELRSYVLVDYVGPAMPQSVADQSTARYLVRVVPADDVLVVQRAIGDRILAAIVRLPTADGYILWRIDETTTQLAMTTKEGDKVTTAEDPKPHGYGRCPLVTVGPMPSITPPVAESQKAMIRADSLLRFRHHEDSIPWLVVTGTNDADKFVIEYAKNPAFTAFQAPDAKAMAIGADVTVAESLRASIEADKEQLYQAAKVRPTAPHGTQSPESGIAQAFRFIDADVELSEVSQAMEQAENQVWQILANAHGIATAPKATWPRTFVPIDRGDELDRLMLISASTLPEPIKEREYQRAGALLYPGDQELASELEQDAAKPDLATPGGGIDSGENPPPAGNPPPPGKPVA